MPLRNSLTRRDQVKSPNTKNLSIPASTAYLATVRDFVGTHAANFGFKESDIDAIRLAVDEACTNVIKHAYEYDDSRHVAVYIGTNNSQFWVSIMDRGRTFDYEMYIEPDIKERIKLKKRGGVGVYLIRQLMDEVEYSHSDGVNEIRMIKHKL
jgi:serine/threonine-protein kinase RsbW